MRFPMYTVAADVLLKDDEGRAARDAEGSRALELGSCYSAGFIHVPKPSLNPKP